MMVAAINPSRGEKHYNAKVTDEQVREIRQAVLTRAEMRRQINERYSNDVLCKKYGLSPRGLDKIIGYFSRIDA